MQWHVLEIQLPQAPRRATAGQDAGKACDDVDGSRDRGWRL